MENISRENTIVDLIHCKLQPTYPSYFDNFPSCKLGSTGRYAWIQEEGPLNFSSRSPSSSLNKMKCNDIRGLILIKCRKFQRDLNI